MKIFVTIGVQDDCDPIDEDIVYVGQDEDKALSFKPNGNWENYKVQTWENGIKLKEIIIIGRLKTMELNCTCHECGLMFNENETIEYKGNDVCPQCKSYDWDKN